MHGVDDHLEHARALADELLFPQALATDAAELVPVATLDRLAREGFYGMAAPADAGGWGLDRAEADRVVEALAGGCLTTTFVWIQHHNPLRGVAASPTPGLAERWLEPLARGDRRAGIALAAERPGPPVLTAEPSDGGYLLHGEAPWVTGWGRIDMVLVAARRGHDVVRALVDADARPSLEVEPLRLVAANASGTVTLRFRADPIAADRVVSVEPHADVMARDAAALRTNGFLALGVAGRCCRLLGSTALDAELDAIRSDLTGGPDDALPDLRARASLFAVRAASALAVRSGARSILIDHHAQRLAREALFLLVFGSRPSIKAALLRRLGTETPPDGY